MGPKTRDLLKSLLRRPRPLPNTDRSGRRTFFTDTPAWRPGRLRPSPALRGTASRGLFLVFLSFPFLSKSVPHCFRATVIVNIHLHAPCVNPPPPFFLLFSLFFSTFFIFFQPPLRLSRPAASNAPGTGRQKTRGNAHISARIS